MVAGTASTTARRNAWLSRSGATEGCGIGDGTWPPHHQHAGEETEQERDAETENLKERRERRHGVGLRPLGLCSAAERIPCVTAVAAPADGHTTVMVNFPLPKALAGSYKRQCSHIDL